MRNISPCLSTVELLLYTSGMFQETCTYVRRTSRTRSRLGDAPDALYLSIDDSRHARTSDEPGVSVLRSPVNAVESNE